MQPWAPEKLSAEMAEQLKAKEWERFSRGMGREITQAFEAAGPWPSGRSIAVDEFESFASRSLSQQEATNATVWAYSPWSTATAWVQRAPSSSRLAAIPHVNFA